MPLDPPRSLSPTRVNAFTNCPLAFRLRTIDRIPEPSSPHAVKGTLVHAALEGLFWNHSPGARTPQAAVAELHAAWERLQSDPELVGLGLDATEAAELLADAERLVGGYFELEDPDRVRAVGIEVRLEADLGPLRLRGIIDRLDLTDDGELVVVDYKTGRAPGPRYEQGRLTGVHLYALLCERVLGKVPVEVRLLHLREPVTITAGPSQQTIRAQRQRTVAVWEAIERACTRDDFRPRPSPLCRSCHFQEWCPSFGGEPPPIGAGALPPPAVTGASASAAPATSGATR